MVDFCYPMRHVDLQVPPEYLMPCERLLMGLAYVKLLYSVLVALGCECAHSMVRVQSSNVKFWM